MLDYKGIEALHFINELQSFELAAQKLHISQSAISQRIKGLETYYGEPVLIRTLPYKPTKLGKYLIGHFQQLSLLEAALEQQIQSTTIKPHISIALNRDSLETWFLEIIEQTNAVEKLTLEIVADDQELTLEYLKQGLVSACLSTSPKEIVGGIVKFLGNMEYFLVASPTFIKKYFSSGNLKQSLLEAPALKFDKKDRLHTRYLEKFFNIDDQEIDYYIVPSVRCFKTFITAGYGYGLIPKIDIVNELETMKLVQITNEVWKIPLYWHYWNIKSKWYQEFNADIILQAMKRLK